MRDAAHELTDRRELLLLHELLDEQLLLTHVAHDTKHADDRVAFDHWRREHRAGPRDAIRIEVAKLTPLTSPLEVLEQRRQHRVAIA